MRSGGNPGSGGAVSSRDDLLGVKKVDTKETHREESDKDEGKYNGDVGRDEIVVADLGSADR